jgi:hypothetical protein
LEVDVVYWLLREKLFTWRSWEWPKCCKSVSATPKWLLFSDKAWSGSASPLNWRHCFLK